MPLNASEIDLARSAFIEAHRRFQNDHAEGNTYSWYASLGETLWWIVALDEHYREAGGKAYEAFRNQDEYGRVVPGLRLARNRVGHQLALLLDEPHNRRLLDQLQWRRFEDLPNGSRRLEDQAESYIIFLAGNAARYALRRANYFFVRRQSDLQQIVEFHRGP